MTFAPFTDGPGKLDAGEGSRRETNCVRCALQGVTGTQILANPLNRLPNWSAVRTRAVEPSLAWARGRHAWLAANDPVYRGWRHPARPERWAGGVAGAVILSLILLLLLFDWNMLRGPIGRWASAKYDRDIAITGDLDVNPFSLSPSASIDGLRIGGPDWADDVPTLQVARIEAAVALGPLLGGTLEFPRLDITRPRAVLIADEQGRKSWMLNPDRPDDGATDIPLIRRLVIRDGSLSYRDILRDIDLQATIQASESAPGEAGQTGFRLDGEGSRNGEPLTLTARGGAFINIRRDRPYEFSAELDGAGTTLAAEGRILRPFDFGRFDAILTLSGRNMADQYPLTGIATPNTPPYRLAGALSRDDDRWTFADFTGRVGASDLSGDLEVDRIDDRLNVTADLASRSLDLDDLAVVLGARVQSTGSGNTVVNSGQPGKLLPDAPLDVSRLRAMDGTLKYRAASVKRNDFEIRQVRLDADLDKAILSLNPVGFSFARGTLIGMAKIDATDDVPNSTIDFRLAGYPVESLIPARNGTQPLTGRALGRAQLSGPGASLHDFASNSSGTMSIVMPQGQMRTAFAELLGINAGRGLSLLLSGDQSTSGVRCAVGDFQVRRGIATARTLVIDTDVVVATGTGTIDLGTETFDLRFDGETKRPRLLRVWAPITVTGPLTGPRIAADTGAIVGQAGVAGLLGALINPLVALLPFVDPGLAEDANCGALIASAR